MYILVDLDFHFSLRTNFNTIYNIMFLHICFIREKVSSGKLNWKKKIIEIILKWKIINFKRIGGVNLNQAKIVKILIRQVLPFGKIGNFTKNLEIVATKKVNKWQLSIDVCTSPALTNLFTEVKLAFNAIAIAWCCFHFDYCTLHVISHNFSVFLAF